MDAKIDNWDDFRLFLAVARAGSLSAAGRAVGVNASTVQRRMTHFEKSLGARLFERMARGYALTSTGEELLAAASRLEFEVLSVSRGVIGRDLDPSGTVRLTTVDAYTHALLLPHLSRFHVLYPRIDLEVSVGTRVLSLGRREADVALRPGAPPSEQDVVARRVCTCAGAVYASRAYLDAHGRPRDYAALRHHRVVTGNDTLQHVSFIRALRERAPAARQVLRSDSVLMQLAAVKLGVGVAAFPCFLADVEPDLVRIFEPHDDLGLPMWLIVHSDLRHNARIRAVADHLYDGLQQDLALLEGRLPQAV
jgi:DNA-binding transcriptional LysR family regulator